MYKKQVKVYQGKVKGEGSKVKQYKAGRRGKVVGLEAKQTMSMFLSQGCQ